MMLQDDIHNSCYPNISYREMHKCCRIKLLLGGAPAWLSPLVERATLDPLDLQVGSSSGTLGVEMT